MGLLSKRAGVAKGTLYLYFATKEEVLLCLYSLEFKRFCNEVIDGVAPGISDTDFVTHLYETGTSEPLFLALHARLGTVIEQNISIDALISSKRTMAQYFHTMVQQLAGPLDLTHEQTLAALIGISALMTGSYDGAATPLVVQEDLPDDIAAFVEYFDMESRFRTTASYVLQGIRASSA